MKKILCVIISLTLLFHLTGCGGNDKAPENQTISYNLPAEPKTLDPQIAADYAAHIIILNLFEGLTRIGQDGTVQPGAAKSWSANADHTQFTFSLRAEAMWAEWIERTTVSDEAGKQKTQKTTHPAQRVTAADFVYGIRRALAPETKSPLASSLFAIKNAEAFHNGGLTADELGVRAVSEDTLVVDLEYSYEEFPALMAGPAAMPCNPAFFDYTKGQYGLETEAILGNGPYVMANRYAWDHRKTLTLTKSSSYQSQTPAVPAGLSFTIGAAQENPVQEIKEEKVDAAALPASSLQKAEEAGLPVVSFEDTTWGLCINTQDPVFSNQSLRKAFLQSIDRARLLSSFSASYSEALDIIPPTTTLGGETYRAQAGSGFSLPYDENSRSVVSGAVTAGEVEKSDLSGISILCPNDDQSKQVVSTLIEIWNKQLGYYFNMNPVDADDIPSRLKMGDYQIAFAPLRAQDDGPGNFLSMFTSSNANNPVGLESGEFDTLLAEAEDHTPETAGEAYAAAERYLCDNAVFYPMYYEKRYFVTAANITGIHFLSYNGGIDFSRAVKTIE